MLLIDYVYWHYIVAPKNILGILRNYLVSTWHRFLIGRHFRTLLSPWHRLNPSAIGTTRTIGDKIGYAMVDFYVRIIAAIIRLSIIIIGLLVEVITLAIFMVLLVVWLIWPVVFVGLVRRGLVLLS